MTLLALLAGIVFSAPLLGQSAESQKGFRPLTAALHVHSRYSNGDYEILELGSFAHQKKIDILGITDSFLTRVRYGVGPFKRVMSRTMTRPGIMDRGLDEYFDSIERAQQQFGDVIMLPGFEVAPYYYWEGHWPGALALHDFDRHILVFGMRDRKTAANLPVIENATWSNSERSLSCLAGPLITVLLGLLLLSRPGKAPRIAAAFVLVVGFVWTYDAYPYSDLPSPYSDKTDHRAFQRLIDYVAESKGLAFWSYPEARYPDITVTGSPARMVSRPRPETLTQTDNYRGFEGLYGDNITITRPGNLWDQLLMDYLRDGRKTWPSAITGIDFHGFKPGNGWSQIDQGITIIFAKEKSEAAVLDALREGRAYASFQDNPRRRIGLEDFALRSNGKIAISGETLESSGVFELSARVDWTESVEVSAAKAEIRVIRDGALLDRLEMPLPATITRTEALKPGRHYYRLMVQLGATQIVSNPIFCLVH